MSKKKIFLFDIASDAGCLEQGTEQSPTHFRVNGFAENLRQSAFEVHDLGGVSIPILDRHNRPPVRNFPSPQIVWEKTRAFLAAPEKIENGDTFICLGGDCSITVGTVAAMADRYGAESLHVVYLDGDTDSIVPNPENCVGAAGMGLYFLTNASEYWSGCRLLPSQITVIGNKEEVTQDSLATISLQKLRAEGITRSIESMLKGIPKDRHLIVHFDVDVLSKDEMPAAYSPREAGLTLSEVENILKLVFADQRVVFFELTEFVPSKDQNGQYAKSITQAIVGALSQRKA